MAKRSEQESYRLAFFIIAQVIMVTMLWLLYQEFLQRRPWKDIQTQWFEVVKERTKQNFESEKKWLEEGVIVTVVDGDEEEEEVRPKHEKLTKTVAELSGSIASEKHAEFEAAKEDLADAQIALEEAELELAFRKASEDEYYYYLRHAKHSGDPSHVEEYQKRWEDAHRAVVEWTNTDFKAATEAKDVALDKKLAFEKTLNEAKLALTDLEADYSKAERAFADSESFAPLKWEVRQFWNQEIDLVDRCHTCHMGYDQCGYADPEEVLNATIDDGLKKRELKAKFCVTNEEADAYLEAAELVMDSWGEEEELSFASAEVRDLVLNANSEDKKTLSEPVLAMAEKLSLTASVTEQLFRTHPNYEGLIRNHPPQVYGCTTCHYGQGRQIKGIGLNYLAAFLWKGERHYAPFNHGRNDHYWISPILENKKNHTEASCFNCHADDYELDYAPNLTRGRKLVQHLGCTGCHPLGAVDPQRKNGPTLTHVSSKIKNDWMYQWVKYPKSLRSRTRMPNFWPEAVNEDGERSDKQCNTFDYERGAPPSPAVLESCYDVREKESAYILAYLNSVSEESSYPRLPSSASVKNGRKIFEEVGCRGCHNMESWSQASTLPGSADRDLAPNLSAVGYKVRTPGWFYEWVKNPKSYWHETRMPSLRLTDEEAWDLAAYLSSAKDGSSPPSISSEAEGYMAEEGAPAKGKKLIAHYGCFGCHDIKGFENTARIGADLTQFGAKAVHKLDFGDVDELVRNPHDQTWEAWLTQKLRAPRSYSYERATTKMPKFDLSEQEIRDVILFLKGQNTETLEYPEHVKHQPTADDRAIQRGAFLIDVYNCGGCHMIDNKGIDVDGDRRLDGGDVFRAYVDTPDAYRAPPKLIGEGAKVYPDWFFSFLKAPFKLRENYKIRMPTFQFTDQEAQDVVAYFAAKAKKPYPFVEKKRDRLSPRDRQLAAKLFSEAQCSNCHPIGGDQVTDEKNVAPNLKLAAARLQYDWLFDWFKNPQELAPGVGMPNFFSPVDDKPGEYETPLIDIAGGDWRRQIELLRAYVIELGLEAELGADNQRVVKKDRRAGKKRASRATSSNEVGG